MPVTLLHQWEDYDNTMTKNPIIFQSRLDEQFVLSSRFPAHVLGVVLRVQNYPVDSVLDSSVFVRLSLLLLFLSTSEAGGLLERRGGARVAGKSPNELSPTSSFPSADSLKVDIFSSLHEQNNGEGNKIAATFAAKIQHFSSFSPLLSYPPSPAPLPGYSRPCQGECSLFLLRMICLGTFLWIFFFWDCVCCTRPMDMF